MTEKSCKCPGCGTDISLSDKGIEISNDVSSDDLIDLEMYVREEIAYLRGFTEAQNKRIDSIELRLQQPNVVKKQ